MEPASALLRLGVEHPAEADAAPATDVSQLIVDTYLPRVHRFAVMVSPPRADPDDLTQEACVRALQRVHQYDASRGTLDAWLWRIVVNLAKDAGRASRRSALLTARLAERASATPLTSPEDVALDHIRDDALVAAVRRLPRRHRTMVAMRYGAGLTTVEIAECLGTTRIATAKTLRRALDRLREDIGNLEEQA